MTSRETQRALVLQGGVAIGVYEAGIFKGLYDRLYKPGESLFDIVAGTSIGAINAAILVSHFTQQDQRRRVQRNVKAIQKKGIQGSFRRPIQAS